jgi:hypothetical protein
MQTRTKRIAALLIALLLIIGAAGKAWANPYRGPYDHRGYYGYRPGGGYPARGYYRGYVAPQWRAYPYGYGYARPYVYPPVPYYGYSYPPYYEAPVAPYYGLRGPGWGFSFTF